MAKFNKIFGLHSIYFIINLERKFCNCITKFYIKILFNFRHIQFIVLKKAINGIKKKKKKNNVRILTNEPLLYTKT